MMGLVLDINTYIGIFLGAIASPAWMKLFGWATAKLIARFPQLVPLLAYARSKSNGFKTIISGLITRIVG